MEANGIASKISQAFYKFIGWAWVAFLAFIATATLVSALASIASGHSNPLTLGINLGIGALAAHFAIKTRRILNAKARPTAQSKRHEIPVFAWPAKGVYELDVVGEGFYQSALQRHAGPHGAEGAETEVTAVLMPYSSNPHDDQAVRIEINGDTVGHLSRDDARSYRTRLAGKRFGAVPASCTAVILGGFLMADGERASYGVKLDIRPFD